MGTDNLHHKRKHRTINSLKRKQSKRESYDVVLIVCEGKKSEPNYLKGLCDELKLNSANIELLGIGVDPLKIVDSAIQKYNETKNYDRVYCVFDKDQHQSYQAALEKINSYQQRKSNGIPIYAINSVPCFEYWLLLHFVDTSKPYVKAGNKSAGDQLCSEIETHIQGYEKGQKNIFSLTKSNLQNALNRAKKNNILQENNSTDNPSTKMNQLVEYLMNLKK